MKPCYKEIEGGAEITSLYSLLCYNRFMPSQLTLPAGAAGTCILSSADVPCVRVKGAGKEATAAKRLRVLLARMWSHYQPAAGHTAGASLGEVVSGTSACCSSEGSHSLLSAWCALPFALGGGGAVLYSTFQKALSLPFFALHLREGIYDYFVVRLYEII